MRRPPQRHLRAAIRSKHAAQVRATAEQLARRGAPVELLQGLSLEQATGTARYRVAMLDRRGGDLNPLSFARGLARAALAAGAAVHGGTRALGMKRVGAHWQLQTAAGVVSAPQVVLATNGYTDDLWPDLRRTVVPLFGAIAATAALPEAIARGVMPSRAALYESGTVTVYYRVDSGLRLLIGGRGPMREITAASSIPYLLAYARTLWPALAAARWTYAWGGRLAMTQDQYLHIPSPPAAFCLPGL